MPPGDAAGLRPSDREVLGLVLLFIPGSFPAFTGQDAAGGGEGI